MSRIGLQTWGSEGDIRPFASLASALAARGHEVTLVTTSPALGPALQLPGVRCVEVGRELALSEAESDELMARCLAIKSPLKQGRLLLERTFVPFVPTMLQAARCLASESDVLIRHYFLHPCRAAADEHGIVDLALYPAPDMLPTVRRPAAGFPALGGLANRLSWSVLDAVVRAVFLEEVNRCREACGVPATRSVLRDVWRSSTLNLIPVSPQLFPEASDWSATHVVTGCFLSAGIVDAKPSQAVVSFLESGPPPVFVGFGSLFPKQAPQRAALIELLIAAAERASVRLLVQTGEDGDVAPSVLTFARCQHTDLLPRCLAAVHHGGAGTTHSALWSGVPSLVIPHLADQFFFGSELARRGLGLRPLPRRELSVDKLARGLKQLQVDVTLRERAASVSAQVRQEQGLEVAISAIESKIRTAMK